MVSSSNWIKSMFASRKTPAKRTRPSTSPVLWNIFVSMNSPLWNSSRSNRNFSKVNDRVSVATFLFDWSSLICSPDEWNSDQVPPINIRVDLIKGDRAPPQVTLRIADRSLNVQAHALDVLLQNLEEIQTAEEKQAKKDRPIQLVPIDIHLTNVEMTLNVNQRWDTLLLLQDLSSLSSS